MMSDFVIRKIVVSLCLFAVAISVGCVDPIYSSSSLTPAIGLVDLPAANDAEFYRWPMRGSEFNQSRSPNMKYLTSFDEPLSWVDPTTAEIVSWEADGLDASVVKVLDDAFRPSQQRLEPSITIERRKLNGPKAFDLTADGKRLAVVQESQLFFYSLESSSVVSQFPLPSALADSKSKLVAVKFCTENDDVLLVTSPQIYRVNSLDGSVVAQCDGIGEPYVQWEISRDGSSMVFLGDSGNVWFGKTKLNKLIDFEVGRVDRFSSVSLYPDGSILGAVVNGLPTMYRITDDKLTVYQQYKQSRLNGGSVSLGFRLHTWADDDQVIYLTHNDDDSFTWQTFPILWKTKLVSFASERDDASSIICVGQRLCDGKVQSIIFDLQPYRRKQSLPLALDQAPVHFAHSRSGKVVAVLSDAGLQVASRELWRGNNLVSLRSTIFGLMRARNFDQIDRLVEITGSQQRLGYGMVPSELQTYELKALAEQWKEWSDSPTLGRNAETLALLAQWRDGGSKAARTAWAEVMYDRGLESRGEASIGLVSQEQWDAFMNSLNEATKFLDRVLADPNPPALAYRVRVMAGLHLGQGFDYLDDVLRECASRFPADIYLPKDLCFKLTPLWFGTTGDPLEFARRTSDLSESASGDLIFLRLVSRMSNYSSSNEFSAWTEEDSERLQRGLREARRLQMDISHELFYLQKQWGTRLSTKISLNDELKDQATELLLELPGAVIKTNEYDAGSVRAVMENRKKLLP